MVWDLQQNYKFAIRKINDWNRFKTVEEVKIYIKLCLASKIKILFL